MPAADRRAHLDLPPNPRDGVSFWSSDFRKVVEEITTLVKLRHWPVGEHVDLPRPAADERGAEVLALARGFGPAKRSTRWSSNAIPRTCTSMLSDTCCTTRALADQESNFARTEAGTRCASGVVQKPLPRSQRPLSTAKPLPTRARSMPRARSRRGR
jgi:hypothetical protein